MADTPESEMDCPLDMDCAVVYKQLPPSPIAKRHTVVVEESPFESSRDKPIAKPDRKQSAAGKLAGFYQIGKHMVDVEDTKDDKKLKPATPMPSLHLLENRSSTNDQENLYEPVVFNANPDSFVVQDIIKKDGSPRKDGHKKSPFEIKNVRTVTARTVTFAPGGSPEAKKKTNKQPVSKTSSASECYHSTMESIEPLKKDPMRGTESKTRLPVRGGESKTRLHMRETESRMRLHKDKSKPVDKSQSRTIVTETTQSRTKQLKTEKKGSSVHVRKSIFKKR